MAQHDVVPTLLLSTPLSDISDGEIPRRCARHIHAIEALFRLRHLDAGLDDETRRRHAIAEIHTHASPCSNRAPTARSSNPYQLCRLQSGLFGPW